MAEGGVDEVDRGNEGGFGVQGKEDAVGSRGECGVGGYGRGEGRLVEEEEELDA